MTPLGGTYLYSYYEGVPRPPHMGFFFVLNNKVAILAGCLLGGG